MAAAAATRNVRREICSVLLKEKTSAALFEAASTGSSVALIARNRPTPVHGAGTEAGVALHGTSGGEDEVKLACDSAGPQKPRPALTWPVRKLQCSGMLLPPPPTEGAAPHMFSQVVLRPGPSQRRTSRYVQQLAARVGLGAVKETEAWQGVWSFSF